MKKAIGAGVLDSGLTSLASLLVFLYAQSVFGDPRELGFFSLFMTSILLGATLVRELIFIPAQKKVLDLDSPQRLILVPRMIGLGLRTATMTGLTVLVATFLVSFEPSSRGILVPFTITAYLAAITLPAQEHSRRMLHLAGFHGSAAFVAATQLILAIGILVGASVLDLPADWVPFSTIALARLLSLGIALGIVTVKKRRMLERDNQAITRSADALTFRQLVRDGRWLVGGAGLVTATNMATVAIVGSIAGYQAAGYAEAARIFASPIQVLGVGLNNALSRRVLAAGRSRDKEVATRVVRVTWLILGVVAVLYGVAVTGAGSIEIVRQRFPVAYEIRGLIAIWVFTFAVVSAALPRRSELIGADHEPSLLHVNVWAAVVQTVSAVALGFVGVTNLAIGSAARPLALGVQGLTNTIGFGRKSKTLHSGSD
ncbi:MAG: hypothetical protein GXP36_09165 [Actinobacteria bacterium]|nr:hypothetical protein [Actinomycetota bacterium]